MKSNGRIYQLVEKGVKIARPESIEIGSEVNLNRISADGVVIHAGCKLFGKNTLICAGTVLGREAPVTIDNCQIGPEVSPEGRIF